MKNNAMEFITYAKSFPRAFHWSKQACGQALTSLGWGKTRRGMASSDK